MIPAHCGSAVFRYRGLKMVGSLNRPAGPEGKRFPAVLLLHGFPGAEKAVDLQRELMKRGVASLALHFCGAWGSEGQYSFTGLVPQARSALRYLSGRDFVDPKRLAVFGFSMGGWTALNLAARADGLKAVAAAAPVGGIETTGPETRGHIEHLCRPLRIKSVDFLHRDLLKAMRRHDPTRSAARLRCPLLLVHGDADELVSFDVSRRLYAAALVPKKFIRAPGSRHDFLDRRDWLSRTVAVWLARELSC